MVHKFSKPDPLAFELSPLGAAIVEALPDRALVRKIKRLFKTKNECPISLAFNRKQLENFYRDRGLEVKAIAEVTR